MKLLAHQIFVVAAICITLISLATANRDSDASMLNSFANDSDEDSQDINYDDFSMELERKKDKLSNIVDQYKRAMKRNGFNAWAGKRSSQLSESRLRKLFNSLDSKLTQSKRAFNSWAGKRLDSTLMNINEDENTLERDRRKPWGGAP